MTLRNYQPVALVLYQRVIDHAIKSRYFFYQAGDKSPYSNLHSKNLVLQLVADWEILGAKLIRINVHSIRLKSSTIANGFLVIGYFLLYMYGSYIGVVSFVHAWFKGSTRLKKKTKKLIIIYAFLKLYDHLSVIYSSIYILCMVTIIYMIVMCMWCDHNL